MKPDPAARRARTSLTRSLLLMVAGSFAFGFALVPLYDVICEAAGIRVNDTPSAIAETTAGAGREVALEFVSIVAPGGEWELVPETTQMTVQPGRLHEAKFLIRSHAAVPVVGQAVRASRRPTRRSTCRRPSASASRRRISARRSSASSRCASSWTRPAAAGRPHDACLFDVHAARAEGSGALS